ncbi:MAG TPA: DUF881 domain-containing protein, partial [Armatimonadota bacterium]|nr:DUF881 domain-containing protein [Armatimonadota bacterium]
MTPTHSQFMKQLSFAALGLAVIGTAATLSWLGAAQASDGAPDSARQRAVRSGGSVGDLHAEVRQLRAIVGLSAVQGPGVRITLRDSPSTKAKRMTAEESQPFRVHEQDLNLLLNELKAAGAEALAVAGADAKTFQRVVPTTTVRCAGPAFIVNGSRLSPPLTVV